VLPSGNGNSAFVLNGEFVFQDGAGNNVSLTSNGAPAGPAGNITTTGSPAYATSDVELLWSGADSEYHFKSGAGNLWASLVFGGAAFRNGANAMTMTSVVTTDYNIIWPAAAAANNDIATFQADGTIAFGKALVGNFTVDGDLTASGDLGHGPKSLLINAIDGVGFSGAGAVVPHSWSGGDYDGWWESTGTADTWQCAIPLKVGDRLLSVRFLFEGISALTTKTFYVKEMYYSTATKTNLASDTSTLGTNSTKTVTMAGSGKVLETLYSYYAQFESLEVGDRLFGIEISYDRP
jgi:hypothetical protein